ncbi:unnamed protein product [Anisakis simplex]|uniref:Transposase n=1 Tax=Anisakis simplex TaxID=6269 RepID=A0A0M3JMP7_ANISI|nr:unnamed protein product [Anisakis simplex]
MHFCDRTLSRRDTRRRRPGTGLSVFERGRRNDRGVTDSLRNMRRTATIPLVVGVEGSCDCALLIRADRRRSISAAIRIVHARQASGNPRTQS